MSHSTSFEQSSSHKLGLCHRALPWADSLVSTGRSSSVVIQLPLRLLPLCKIWLRLANGLKKGGERKKERKYMQNQLHPVCLFPMETRLNRTHYKMNTQFSASYVSEHKMTEKPQAAESISPSLSRAGISVTIALIPFSCCIALRQWNGKGTKEESRRDSILNTPLA